MTKKKRPTFYRLRRLEREARRSGSFVVSSFSITKEDGSVVHLGPGILKHFIQYNGLNVTPKEEA